MSSTIFFYDQAPNRTTPKRCRKYASSRAPSPSVAKAPTPASNTPRDDKKPNATDGLVKKSLMPEINLAYHSVRNHFDSTLTNDEDSQRHLFEQAKFSAPDILQRLSLYLYDLPDKRGLIPKSLEYQLLCGYDEFTRNVVLVPREWQTAAMREHVRNLRKKSDTHVQNGPGSVEASEQRKKAEPSGNNSQNQLSTESLLKGRKRIPSSVETTEEDSRNLPISQRSKDKERLTPRPSGVPAKSSSSRTQSRLMSINCAATAAASADASDNKSPALQPIDKSINIRFSLASATSWRQGYASVNGGLTDADRLEILKRCVRILQTSKRNANQEKNQRKPEKTRDYSLLFYGSNIDQSKAVNMTERTRLRLRPLNKKQPMTLENVQPPKIPKLGPSGTEEEKQLLQTITNCKTTIIHYKSGRIAVLRFQTASCPGNCNHPTCYYTLVFDDTPSSKILLIFQPDGTGCCHFKNGHLKLIFNATDAYIFTEHGEVVHHSQWGRNKPLPVITHQLNAQISLRSSGPNNLGLIFKCDSYVFKFHLSTLPPGSKAGCYIQQRPATGNALKKEILLKTTGPFLSSYAKELVRTNNSKQKVKQTPNKEILQKDEFQRSLELSDKVRFGLSNELVLLQLKRKAKHLVDDWMEHFQEAIGLRPKEVPRTLNPKSQTRRLRRTHSAVMIISDSPSQMKALGLMPVSNDQDEKQRLPSAPPVIVSEIEDGMNEERLADEDDMKQSKKPETLSPDSGIALQMQTHTIRALEHVSKTADKLRVCCESSNRNQSSRQSQQSQGKTTPKMTRTPKRPAKRQVDAVLGIPCTPALRTYMSTLTGPSNHVFCRCSVSLIPHITDLEYDQFIYKESNNKQMVVVAVVSSRFPESNPGLQMLEQVYQNQNRNRRHPCVESKTDMFRILQYDVNKATGVAENRQPLLLNRHNVVPGMVLIYCHGDLLFCNHIFNGYGCAEDDFRHQLRQCHTRALVSFSLPKDFKFSPARGKQGICAQWGGQIGGAGVDYPGHPENSSVAATNPRASILTNKLCNINNATKKTLSADNKPCEEKDRKGTTASPLMVRCRAQVKDGASLFCARKTPTFKKNIASMRNNSEYSLPYRTFSHQRRILPQVVVTEQK